MMPGDKWITPYATYGEALAALRNQRGLSINELAHRSHLNARQVRRFEANEAIPIGKELEKIERNLRGLPAYRHLIRVEKIQTVKITIPDFELPPPVSAASAPSSMEIAADSVPAASAPSSMEIAADSVPAASAPSSLEIAADSVPAVPFLPAPSPPPAPLALVDDVEGDVEGGSERETERDIMGKTAGWNARLRAARKAKGLSQEQLAELIGVSAGTINRWEIHPRNVIMDPAVHKLETVFPGIGLPSTLVGAALHLTLPKTDGEKRCPHCGKTKPKSEFYRASYRADGLNPYCIQCAAEVGAKKRAAKSRPAAAKTIRRPELAKVAAPAPAKAPDFAGVAAALDKARIGTRDAQARVAKIREALTAAEREVEESVSAEKLLAENLRRMLAEVAGQ